jgi:hypothetical protein
MILPWILSILAALVKTLAPVADKTTAPEVHQSNL